MTWSEPLRNPFQVDKRFAGHIQSFNACYAGRAIHQDPESQSFGRNKRRTVVIMDCILADVDLKAQDL
jgi:hypothetical protein